MKIFKSSLIVLAIAAVIIGVTKLPRHSTPAEAQTSSVPVVGIQAAEGSGSGGCTRNLTNIAYSSNPSDYAGSATYDGNPYGNTDCARIWLSGTGPFTQDFRIGVRMQNPKASGGWGPWGWTYWASDIAKGTTPGWSPWVGAIVNAGSDPGHAMYQVTLDTRGLPDEGDTIFISSIGLQEGDGNNNSAAPYYCNQGPSGTGDTVYAYGSGWSTGGKPASAPAGFSGVGDLADCTRIYLGSASILGAKETANNIPTAFAPSEKKTTGSDGSSLSITMKNIGTTAWTPTFASNDKNGTQSGTCTYAYESSNGVLNAPASGSAASSCSVTTDLTSTDYFLVHGGSFSVSPEKIPISYTGITKTITYTPAYTETVTVPCNPNTLLKNDNNNIFSFIKKAFALTTTATGKCRDTRDIPESWNVSYSVGGSVIPGQSFVFPITSLTAPSAAGTYNESWQMQYANNAFGAQFTTKIIVAKSTPSVTGTVNVSSTNIVTGKPVVASWSANGPTTESSVNVSSASYTGLPLTGGVANYTVLPGSAPGFALGVVKGQNVAQANNGNTLVKTLAAIRNAFASVAFAAPTFVEATVSPADSQTLTTAVPVADFTIGWYPIAAMSVSPSSVALDASGNGQIKVKNTGADGSELDWTASTASTWFTLSPGSGSVMSGAEQNIGLSVASGLAPGNYTGTVQVTGTSKYCSVGGCTDPIPLSKITITFTVPKPAVTVSSITVSVNPSSVVIGSTAQAACTVTMSDASTNHDCTLSSSDTSIASVNAGTGVVTGKKPGTANVIGTANADSSKTGTAGITVKNSVASLSVAVSPSWITLTGTGADAGKTAQATAVVTMADGSTNSDVTYASDNAAVASVDGASGLVTPHAVGTANIVATTNSNLTPTMSGSAGITVSTTGCTGSGCGGCTGSGCPSGTGITVAVTATPTTIKSSGTATCKATVAGNGSYSSAVAWSAINGSISGSGNTVTLVPSGSGTATCKATSQADTTKSGSATVSVTSGGGAQVNQPSCTLSANPTSVVVPASSVLTYSCKYVRACTLSGGGFGSSSTVNVDSTTATAKGTTKDAPTQNTIYDLNCTGSESSASANASVIVTVTNPGRSETSTF